MRWSRRASRVGRGPRGRTPAPTIPAVESPSSGPPERKVEAEAPGERMQPVDQRCHPVVPQPRGSAPHDGVAVIDRNADRFDGTLQSTEQKYRRQPQRDRHDWLAEIFFVAILMQRQPGARLIAADQTGVGRKVAIPGLTGGAPRGLEERRGQRWPWTTAVRVDRIVAVAAGVAHPANGSAIAHRDRHPET